MSRKTPTAKSLRAFSPTVRTMIARWISLTPLLVLAALALPHGADAQILRKVKDVVKGAVEDESLLIVDEAVRRAVRGSVGCVFSDLDCIHSAEEAGEDVYLTDEDGNVLTDDGGELITDPQVAAEKATVRPGEGAWANYDFLPGDRMLFAEDFSDENVGDFPKRLEFVRGGMEVVEWEDRSLLRITSKDSRFAVKLPEDLPEQFTLEFDAYVGHPNAPVIVSTYELGPRQRAHTAEDRPYLFFDGAAGHSSGIHQSGQPVASAEDLRIGQEIVTIRLMVDGAHAKVFMNERRLANHPQVELERGDRVYFAFPDVWTDRPILVGDIRVAAGGKDLYDKLAEDGRVATRGIFFDTGSARIQPESSPTLDEIGTMLQEHPDLSLLIEGHTDDVGEDDSNLELSDRRAASVRRFIVANYEVDEARLTSEGFGESNPADTNDTPEGRQNNRRVELVRVEGGTP